MLRSIQKTLTAALGETLSFDTEAKKTDSRMSDKRLSTDLGAVWDANIKALYHV